MEISQAIQINHKWSNEMQRKQQAQKTIVELKDLYSRGVATPMQVLTLVRLQAPNQLAGLLAAAGVNVYSTVEIMEIIFDQFFSTQHWVIEEWINFTQEVADELFFVFAIGDRGMTFSLRKEEVDMLDLSKLRKLSDRALSM